MFRVLAAVLALFWVAGCASEPQTPPKTEGDRGIETDTEFWQENISTEGDAFMVTVVVPVKDTLKNAKDDARTLGMRRACEMAVKDYLRDISKYEANQDEINRQILNQSQKFLKDNREVKSETSKNGKQYGLVLRVVVNDQAIKNVLQDLGMIRAAIAERKVILAIYGGRNVDKELIGDVGRSLAEYYNKQGYNAVLWDEIAQDIADERNVGEKSTEAFIQKFVESPEFQGDAEYQGTLGALRNRGRLVIGFNVIKVSVQNGTVNTGIKAFAKDLLTGRVFANHQEYGNRTMARDSDRDLAISESTYKAAEACSGKIVKETNDWFDKNEQLKKGTEYTFRFTGFSDDDILLIDKTWRDTFSGGGDGNMEGGAYVRTYTGEETGAALCDKVDMMLKKAGLKARKPLPNSRATSFDFKKQ
ncbi:MAG: hypothetical protein HUU15_02140 [Candidatus Brocadiae bacterium]|nr:hypothetical protein [Candidatus Brocadiia bacterium]